jgi:hypothetical protein
MKLTKLSELVSSTPCGNNESVSYSWHTQTKGQNRDSFVLYISQYVLKLARFRENDRCEIEFGESEIIITLGEGLPFSVNARKETKASRQIKVSSKGVESVQAILPKVNRVTELDVISTEVGKIRVRIPSSGREI